MSLKHLPQPVLESLKAGRAIAFLVEYRTAELPDHPLTVVATVDDEAFWGALMTDGYDGEMVNVLLEGLVLEAATGLKLESADAMAVNRLWNRWHHGVREQYLELARMVAQVNALDRQRKVLEALDSVGSAPGKKKSRERKSAVREPEKDLKNRHSDSVKKEQKRAAGRRSRGNK